MGKTDLQRILFFAQGKEIAELAEKVRNELPDPSSAEIIIAHMEETINVVRRLSSKNYNVIIARGTTAYLLQHANLPVSVVEIPIGAKEIADAFSSAAALTSSPDARIGVMGFRTTIDGVQPFLNLLNYRIKLYEFHTTPETMLTIPKIREDGTEVLIAGVRTSELLQKEGFKTVILGSSLESIRDAFRQAMNLQHALQAEKMLAKEKSTIFDAVSEAILSITKKRKVTLQNRPAMDLFHRTSANSTDIPVRELFNPQEIRQIDSVLEGGDEISGSILKRGERKFAVQMLPINVYRELSGMVVVLQEIASLQKLEMTVRKKLQPEGNVAKYHFADIKGESPEIIRVKNQAQSFALLPSNILLIGQTGTGKELFAQSIHNASLVSSGPFVAVNCGAIPEDLVESELFGYVEGAFTGARKGGKPGMFEQAHGGTIFLDEVSEMNLSSQVILLRALQEHQIRRVGSNVDIPIQVRVIAACNTNLYQRVRENRFRKDLYYRLCVLTIQIPDLNQREGDIRLLANYFISEYNKNYHANVVLSSSAIQELENFTWDGNVRQLKNFCERITATRNSSILTASFVREELNNAYRFMQSPKAANLSAAIESDDSMFPHDDIFNRECGKNLGTSGIYADTGSGSVFPSAQDASGPQPRVMIRGQYYTRQEMLLLMKKAEGNRSNLASSLHISRTTLWKDLKLLGIT